MAGLDHAVHPSTIGSERYDACQKAVRKPGYWAQDGWQHTGRDSHPRWVWVDDQSSKECRYDLSLKDSKCEGCSQRGVGVAYDEFIRRNGT